MLMTFATNENNDLYLDAQGNIAMVFGIEAAMQVCKNAVQAQLGEMIYNTDQGIPNFQNIWTGVINEQQWEVAIANTLEAVTDVTNVVSIDVTIANNTISYTAVILTTYGQGTLNGNF
jgi:predicted hotdog family 3-hydroxylacyl-ACP dehydratase